MPVRLPSVRHPPNSFTLSTRYHAHGSDPERSPPIYFEVTREEVRELPNTLSVFTSFQYHAHIRLSLEAPPLAPPFWRDGVHPDSPLSPHRHRISHPRLVGRATAPIPLTCSRSPATSIVPESRRTSASRDAGATAAIAVAGVHSPTFHL